MEAEAEVGVAVVLAVDVCAFGMMRAGVKLDVVVALIVVRTVHPKHAKEEFVCIVHHAILRVLEDVGVQDCTVHQVQRSWRI